MKLTQFSVDNAADAIFWLNKNGKFIYANNAAVEHIGYSKEEILSMTVHEIDYNFPIEKWDQHWEKLKRKKKAIFESLHTTKNGKNLPVEIMVSHLEVDDIEFHCVYVRDITERKRAEESLQLSEKRFRKTLDVTSDGMWDRNLVTGEVYYGSNWASALGFHEDDLITGKIRWEKLLHKEDRDKALQAVKDHIDGKTKSYKTEFRLKNSDNGWQWMQARGKVIEYSENNRPIRFVVTHTDIIDRKEAEDSLLKRT